MKYVNLFGIFKIISMAKKTKKQKNTRLSLISNLFYRNLLLFTFFNWIHSHLLYLLVSACLTE